jgi:transcriptional regulator with GAF, ATPase, and Fis domain
MHTSESTSTAISTVFRCRDRMRARLIALGGPLKGGVFPLPAGEFTLGRENSNAICLAADRAVSRHHCVIDQDGEEFRLRDLDSANRTYIDDAAITQRGLEHGNEIRIGRSVFLFVVDGKPIAHRNVVAVDLDEGGAVPGSTVILRRQDAAYTRPEAMLDAAAQSECVARSLKAILRVSHEMSSASDLMDLQRLLMEAVFESIPAQRGAILLAGKSPDNFASTFHWVLHAGQSPPFRIPRGIIQRIFEERAAVCVNDIESAQGTIPSESIARARVTCILAVPVVSPGDLITTIYLDTSDPGVRFTEDHLQLLAGIAELAATPLTNAHERERLEFENERLSAELAGNQALLGTADRMRAVHRTIVKVAPTDSTVLITGSSGTGKELVARAIHRNSSRYGKPFVAINCAAVTETLLESEFFGHEKGSFTGAVAQKKGKLEEADGGTVFLDEIGELALPLQAKLLRVLQEREFERVGGTRPIKVNLRVLTATNRDLEQEVRRGTFRQDLFYRLNVISVNLPDLRDRREDIPLLATHFVKKHAKARRVLGISPEGTSCLMSYDWPGNVRELENAIERAIVLGSTEQILPDDLPDAIVESAVSSGAATAGAKFHETIREMKKRLVTHALQEANGSCVEAAKLLGLHPNNLYRLMKTLALK